jgi:hypothetical protein
VPSFEEFGCGSSTEVAHDDSHGAQDGKHITGTKCASPTRGLNFLTRRSEVTEHVLHPHPSPPWRLPAQDHLKVYVII